MKKQNILLAMIFTIVAVLTVLPTISAGALSVTLYAPVNYTNHTGTVTYNCTTPAHAQVMNVSIYANSSTGTMTLLGSVNTNTSVNQTIWEGSETITASNDGTGYNISCYAGNSTANAYSAEISATKIILDTTAPICNISFGHSTIAYAGRQTIEYYSSDATLRRLTTIDVDGPGKQTTITLTSQNGPIELASNDTKYSGSWTVNMTVTDWAGNSCTASETFKSYLPDKKEELPPTPTGKGGPLLIIGIIGAIVYFAIIKKKK